MRINQGMTLLPVLLLSACFSGGTPPLNMAAVDSYSIGTTTIADARRDLGAPSMTSTHGTDTVLSYSSASYGNVGFSVHSQYQSVTLTFGPGGVLKDKSSMGGCTQGATTLSMHAC